MCLPGAGFRTWRLRREEFESAGEVELGVSVGQRLLRDIVPVVGGRGYQPSNPGIANGDRLGLGSESEYPACAQAASSRRRSCSAEKVRSG